MGHRHVWGQQEALKQFSPHDHNPLRPTRAHRYRHRPGQDTGREHVTTGHDVSGTRHTRVAHRPQLQHGEQRVRRPMNELPNRRVPSKAWRARLGNYLSQAARDIAAALDEVGPPGFTVIASWVHPEPESVLLHGGIGRRGIALSPNGGSASVDDRAPYRDAARADA